MKTKQNSKKIIFHVLYVHLFHFIKQNVIIVSFCEGKRRGKMVDNRSAGVLGIGGSFNFKSGDISGTAAKTSDDKQDQGTEYFLYEQNDEEQEQKEKYRDRSNELRASLNSLAVINSANIRLRKAKEKALEKKQNKTVNSSEDFDIDVDEE